MSPVFTRPVSMLPPGTAFSRFLMCKSIQDRYGTKEALDAAATLTTTPQVAATLEAEFSTKAAVSVGTTSD